MEEYRRIMPYQDVQCVLVKIQRKNTKIQRYRGSRIYLSKVCFQDDMAYGDFERFN